MGPDHDLLAGLRGGLARVRWENVVLLLLMVVAIAGVVMGGALTGRGASPLPDDVGVRGQSPRATTSASQRRGAENKNRAMKERVEGTTDRRRRRRRPDSKRNPHRGHRHLHRTPTGDSPAPVIRTPIPPPSPPAGSEFAPG